MADQVIGAEAAATEVPAVETPQATTETVVETPTAPETVAEQDLNNTAFDKIDPSKLKGMELKLYKKWQGNFTKSTQEWKTKLDSAMKQIEAFKPLLSDPDVQAKSYFLQNGRWPEGYAKAQAPVKEPEPQINPEDITDPFARKLYEDNLAMKARLDKIEGQTNEGLTQSIEGTAQGYYDKLSPEQKEIWQANFSEIQDIATNLIKTDRSNTPVTEKVKKALSRAFNAAAGSNLDNFKKKIAEDTEKAVYEKIKKKKEEVRPETGLNVTTVPGKVNSIEEAVAQAMSMSGNK